MAQEDMIEVMGLELVTVYSVALQASDGFLTICSDCPALAK